MIDMKLVNVYNIKRFMEHEFKDENLTTLVLDDKFAIIENEDGKSLVVTREGVSTSHDNRKAHVLISLVDKPTIKGVRQLGAKYSVYYTIDELLQNCESEQMELGKFIREHGSRLERNYELLIKRITNHLNEDGRLYDNGRLKTCDV